MDRVILCAIPYDIFFPGKLAVSRPDAEPQRNGTEVKNMALIWKKRYAT